jgi:phage/plasmid-like protein (TIGR03299 family)
MSTETSQWLNNNVLVGMTSKRGQAWHYKASDQGAEPNHYEGAIPIEDVQRRLFHWSALEVPMFIAVPSEDGKTASYEEVPNKNAIVRSDTYEVLGVPSKRYVPHQNDEWLLTNVKNLLDDDLVIGSAGLLKNGAISWVQIEMPENCKVGDIEFRPNLLATTSFDGSIATTYKRTVTIVVCDNTRAMALGEQGQEIRIRHTANSFVRLGDAREALNIVHTMEDEFTKEIEKLLSQKVSDNQFTDFLDKLVPVKNTESKQAVTRAENIQNQLRMLWNTDSRVAPWKNTAFGALQAVNTHRQHFRNTRKGNLIVERTMLDSLNGKLQMLDEKANKILQSII